MLVLDLGGDIVSLWTPGTGVVSEPARVVFEANRRYFDPDLLTRSLRAWVLERSALVEIEGVPVILPLPSFSAGPLSSMWCDAVHQIGGNPVLVHRPLAAAVGLGIQTDQPGCHLLAEVSKGHIDLAVIRDGSVVTSRRVPGHENRLVGLVSGESLRSLDPDDELEIRDHGVYLYGWAAAGYAADSLSAIGLPLAAPIPRGPTVLIGACLMAEEVLSWLRAEQ